jgi:ABC-type sugar transport system substrate-binding protein
VGSDYYDGAPPPDPDEQPQEGMRRADLLARAGAVGLGASIASTLFAANALAASGGREIAPKFKNKTIGVPLLQVADQNELVILQAFKDATDQAGLNWKWIADDCQGNQQKSQQVTASYISRGVDGLALMVIPERWIPAQLADAKKKKIPVIGLYTFAWLAPTIAIDYGALLGPDAALLALYLFNEQRNRKPNQKKYKIGVLNASLDVVQARVGALEGLVATTPDFEIAGRVDNIDVANISSSTVKAALALLQKNPDLDVLWSSYPPMGVPAASAVSQAGKQGKVQVYAHVAGDAGLDALKDPKSPMQAMSWADLVWNGYAVVDYFLELFAGRPVPRFGSWTNAIPMAVIDKTTVSKDTQLYKVQGKNVRQWMFQRGAYRASYVAKWKAKYGA